MVRDLSDIPAEIRIALAELSMAEEMLLSPVLPIMSVLKTKTGRDITRGYVANFLQDSLGFVKNIPRVASNVPILVVTRKGSDGRMRETKVNRERVSLVGRWLVENNPVFKEHGVKFQQGNAEMLPVDGYLDHQTAIEPEESGYQEGAASGPMSRDEIADSEDEELLDYEVFVEQNLNTESESEQTRQRVLWPHINTQAINEYEFSNLASLAFFKLFPLGQADPTKKERLIKVTEKQATTHLMRYAEIHPKTGDLYYPFTSHPRFLFWMNDRIRRHSALNQADIFMNKNPADATLTMEDLKRMVSERDASIMKRLSNYSANITGSYLIKHLGSNSYWYQKRQELEAAFKQIDPGTVFFTLSFADYHWHDLHRLMPEGLAEPGKHRIRNANRHPHLCDWFFSVRFEAFMKHFFEECLGMTWHWYRFEWQSRTAIHVHGTGRLASDPGITKLVAKVYAGELAKKQLNDPENELDEEEIQSLRNTVTIGELSEARVVTYCDTLVTAMNPRDSESQAQHVQDTIPNPHPASTRLLHIADDQEALNDQYERLVNCTQRHICRPDGYCKSKEGEGCRFGYPIETRDKTSIVFEETETTVRAKLALQRNDPYFNVCNRTMAEHWLANVDMKIILDYHAAIAYMVKYVSKAEKEGASLQNVFNSVIQPARESDSAPTKIRSLMIRSTGQRDVGMGETCRQISGGKHCVSNLEFVKQSIDINQERLRFNPDGSIVQYKSLLYYFGARHVLHSDYDEDISDVDNFIDFVRKYKLQKGALIKRKKSERVVVITFPSIRAVKGSVQYPMHCHYQLLRYWNWIETDLPDFQDPQWCVNTWESFLQEAPEQLLNYCRIDDDLQDQLKKARESGVFDQEVDTEELFQTDWMQLSSMMPENATEPESDIVVDQNHDWSQTQLNYTTEQLEKAPTWLEAHKQNCGGEADKTLLKPVLRSTLNPKQLIWHDYIIKKLELDEQALLIVNGTAGTGKSHTISAISTTLGPEAVIRSSFTAKAAFLIDGSTLHTVFQLKVEKDNQSSESFTLLKGKALKKLQERFRNVRIIIIDEYSMLSLALLGKIDHRLRQASGEHGKYFGGFVVCLVGDPAQLLPVGGTALHLSSNKPCCEEGKVAYEAFKDVIILERCERQQNESNDPIQGAFINLLSQLRNGICTQEGWELLMSRQISKLNQEDQDGFVDALRLFCTNREVETYNDKKMMELNNPITRIQSINSSKTAQRHKADEYRGIENHLYLSIGCKITLTTNLWTEVGLTNGAKGTVRDIVYHPGAKMPDLPAFIVIEMEVYRGSSFFADENKSNWIPFGVREYDSQNFNHKRKGYPIKVAYAMTIHKSQVVIDLGNTERSLGLSFVALSRVKTIYDLVMEPCAYDRLYKIRDSKSLRPRLVEEERLRELEEVFLLRWNE